jgi:hypothetical protein
VIARGLDPQHKSRPEFQAAAAARFAGSFREDFPGADAPGSTLPPAPRARPDCLVFLVNPVNSVYLHTDPL